MMQKIAFVSGNLIVNWLPESSWCSTIVAFPLVALSSFSSHSGSHSVLMCSIMELNDTGHSHRKHFSSVNLQVARWPSCDQGSNSFSHSSFLQGIIDGCSFISRNFLRKSLPALHTGHFFCNSRKHLTHTKWLPFAHWMIGNVISSRQTLHIRSSLLSFYDIVIVSSDIWFRITTAKKKDLQWNESLFHWTKLCKVSLDGSSWYWPGFIAR